MNMPMKLCDFLRRQHILAEGDMIIATMGERVSKIGSTNSLKSSKSNREVKKEVR